MTSGDVKVIQIKSRSKSGAFLPIEEAVVRCAITLWWRQPGGGTAGSEHALLAFCSLEMKVD